MRIFLSLIFLFTVSLANASTAEMSLFADKVRGSSFNGNFLPVDYTAKEVKFVKWSPALVAQLEKMEAKSTKAWLEYVESGELNHLSDEEFEKAKNDPAGYFDDKYLTQISAQYEVYQNGKLIGYAVDIIDHVMSTFYEDSAGTVIYLDVDLNIVLVDDWAA